MQNTIHSSISLLINQVLNVRLQKNEFAVNGNNENSKMINDKWFIEHKRLNWHQGAARFKIQFLMLAHVWIWIVGGSWKIGNTIFYTWDLNDAYVKVLVILSPDSEEVAYVASNKRLI